MRKLTITETDAGQWVAETSSGVRWHAASLDSLLDKLAANWTLSGSQAPAGELLEDVFIQIKRITTGQITRGQAGG